METIIMEIASNLVDSGNYDWPKAISIATEIVNSSVEEPS